MSEVKGVADHRLSIQRSTASRSSGVRITDAPHILRYLAAPDCLLKRL
jgi:hypothetical protein